MKCYLVKNHPFPLISGQDAHGYRYRYRTVPLKILPFKDDQVIQCSVLRSMLETYKDESHDQKDTIGDSFWNIDVGFGVSTTAEVPNEDENSDHFLGYIKLNERFSGSVLEALRHFGGNEVQVKAEFDVIDERNGSQCTLSSKEMRITKGTLICADDTIRFPVTHFQTMDMTKTLVSAHVTITVSVPNEIFKSDRATKLMTNSMCKNVLDDGIFSDVTIVAGNGSEIKAHRVFLAARSSAFLKMFQADIEELRESVVYIPDINEESVRIFLKYLYYADTNFLEGSCQLIFELYYIAHKYHVSDLEQLMRNVIMNKPREWLDVETAVRMFLFGRKMTPEDDELKSLAMKALKL